jgi:hypothetical protein
VSGEPLLTDEVRALVGREWPSADLEVERTGIRMWARAVGFDDPVFYDDDVARERGFDAVPAPPGFVGTLRSGPGDPEPGPPIRGLHPALTRSLNGGTDFEYLAAIVAGDVLTASTTIVDVVEKVGSIGPMLVFRRETTYRRDGEPVAIMRQTVINY